MKNKKNDENNHSSYLWLIAPGFIRIAVAGLMCIAAGGPLSVCAQQSDSNARKSNKKSTETELIKVDSARINRITEVKGKITDAVTGKPVIFVRVTYVNGKQGTNSNETGNYDLVEQGVYKQIKFSFVGYKTVIKTFGAGEEVNIKLESVQTQLNEVVVKSAKRQRYRNKNNPAVSVIQEVIDHKEQNRMEDANYLQYDQYERIIMSVIDLSPQFLNSRYFSKFRFLLDTSEIKNDKPYPVLPVYMSEKLSKYYYRKEPQKTINIAGAHKQVDFSALIDPKGFDIYLNRLYGQVNLYDNNIFIVTNQFLSPIADHAPDFYKFFISDTLQSGKEKLLEISFVPRNRGDLLFEGKLYVTMDGNYAVMGADLKIDKQINLNFLRLLQIHQDFEKNESGRYHLIKSDVKIDFGIFKNKGFGFSGDRTVFYTNYKMNSPLPAPFYDGNSNQSSPDTLSQKDNGFWAKHRVDTLKGQQGKLYANIDSLQTIPSFRRTEWVAKLIAGGYAYAGPLQIGPIDATYTFNYVEGTRLRLGGRTTPEFNKSVYLEGYGAYGFKDEHFKYYLSTAFSFNSTAPYLYPNNYLKVSYQYDTDIPGQNFLINKTQSLLGSFRRGTSDLWLYNKILRLDYVRDFPDHFSFDAGFKHWEQDPAGLLFYETLNNPNKQIKQLTTSEFDLLLRYAPNEKFLQGTVHRFIIPSKYPIFTLNINSGNKGLWNGQYNYLNLSANIYKRFYLSQLGYTDFTLLGGTVLGQVPFPLLAIIPANQTYLYDRNAYNMMNFLEFVADHYAGLNITHYFGGFFLNKIPVIESFKLREILSFKIIYGGLRDENNPSLHPDLYKFPTFENGSPATFALGNTPYIEAGVGVSNIFKVLRLDVIHRFNYLGHQGVTPWGLRFTLSPDL